MTLAVSGEFLSLTNTVVASSHGSILVRMTSARCCAALFLWVLAVNVCQRIFSGCCSWPVSRCRAMFLNAPWLSWGSPSFRATVIRQWAKAPHNSSAATRGFRPLSVASWDQSMSSRAFLEVFLLVHPLSGSCPASLWASSITAAAKPNPLSSAFSGSPPGMSRRRCFLAVRCWRPGRSSGSRRLWTGWRGLG